MQLSVPIAPHMETLKFHSDGSLFTLLTKHFERNLCQSREDPSEDTATVHCWPSVTLSPLLDSNIPNLLREGGMLLSLGFNLVG